jgi:prepilin-type processing-associated H-X9-DG protein
LGAVVLESEVFAVDVPHPTGGQVLQFDGSVSSEILSAE